MAKLMLPACMLCFRKGEKTFAGDEPVTFTFNGEESTLWLCDKHRESIVEFLTDLQAVARGDVEEDEEGEIEEEFVKVMRRSKMDDALGT